MRDYLLRRALQAVLTIFTMLTLNFFLFRILPGDPVTLLARDPRMPPEFRELLRHELGLDLPLGQQYVVYLKDTFQGQWGMSFVFKIPVLPVVMERLMNTVILTMTATLLAIGIGIFFGVVSAWKRHTKVDGAILGLTLTMYSMPAFWLSMIMILLFAVYGRLLPSSGMMSYGTSFGTGVEYVLDVLRHLTLPVTALTAQLLGEYALIMRGSMLDVMTEDYILTARAKGLSEWAVLRKHAFKNAMLPTATLIAINLGYTVSGAIQTETVFNWPGVGRLMYDAVLRLDYPVLQGCFLILAIAVIAANFCADIIYGLIDPRVKTGAAT